MNTELPPEFRNSHPEFRGFLDKLRRVKGWSYKTLARNMGTPGEILNQRVRQLERFFHEDGEPRVALAKAVERALDKDLNLPAEDYGWDPTKP